MQCNVCHVCALHVCVCVCCVECEGDSGLLHIGVQQRLTGQWLKVMPSLDASSQVLDVPTA